MLTERTRRAQFLLGGRQARHVAPAILLGVTAGAACGWNLSFAVLVTLALWLNTPLLLLATAAVAGSAMALCCESLATTIGRALLDKCDLGSTFYAFAPGPAAALFGLDDYRLVGNLGLGLLVGVPAAHALSRLMCRPSAGDDEAETPAADPMLRPLGFLPATCSAGLTAALVFAIGPRLVGEAALERLTAAIGAPVSVDRFDYDLWRGELEITNLRVADVRDGRTLFTARRVEGRVEPGLFLRGRLHAEEFAIGGVSFDLSGSTRSEKALALYARRPSILKDDAEQSATPADPAADVEVQTTLRHLSKANDRLAAMAAAIGQIEWIADLEAPHTAGGKRLDMLVRRKAAPRDVAGARTAPLVKLKQVRIDGLAEFAELGPQVQVTLSNLTSRPSTAGRHAQLTLTNEGTFHLQTTFHLADPERQHAVTFELSDVAGSDLVNAAAIHTIDVRDSRVEMIRGNGTATRDRFDIRLLVMARGVKATAEAKPAGIDGDLFRESLARLPTVQLALKADGRWSQPRLSFSPPAAVRDLKSLLRVNGAGELATAMESGKPYKPGETKRKTAPPTVHAAPSVGGVTTAGGETAGPETKASEGNLADTTIKTAQPGAGPLAPAAPAGPAPGSPLAAVTNSSPGAPYSITPASMAPASASPFSRTPTSMAPSSPAAVSPAPSATSAGPATGSAVKPLARGTPGSGANLAATLNAGSTGMGTAAPATAQTAGLRQPAGAFPPMVQRTAHTVAQRPTGGAAGGTVPGGTAPGGIVPLEAGDRSTTPLVSDEFSPQGTTEANISSKGPQLPTEGLRQPTSVTTPTGMPGPLHLEAGPELMPAQNRAASSGRRPQTAGGRTPSNTMLGQPGAEEFPTPNRGVVDERSTTNRGIATSRSATGERSGTTNRGGTADRGETYRTNPSANRYPAEENAGARDLPTLPRRTLMTRDGTEPAPSGATFGRGAGAYAGDGESYDVPATPKPEKKSFFSGVTKLFGKKEPPQVEHSATAGRDHLRGQAQTAPPSTYLPDRSPADRGAPEMVEPEPKSESFPILRSLFGGKPKPAGSVPEVVEEPRGLLGGSKNYDGGKIKGSKPKGRGIFGSRASSAPETDAADYATPSGFVTDGDSRGRVPTAEYEAPVGSVPGAAAPAGGVGQATDLEPARGAERISAGKPWYDRMVR